MIQELTVGTIMPSRTFITSNSISRLWSLSGATTHIPSGTVFRWDRILRTNTVTVLSRVTSLTFWSFREFKLLREVASFARNRVRGPVRAVITFGASVVVKTKVPATGIARLYWRSRLCALVAIEAGVAFASWRGETRCLTETAVCT